MELLRITNEKSKFIEKLADWKYREAYVRASVNVNLPSQIRALRLRQGMIQKDLANASKMLQPRISAMEKPGAIKFNIETLVRLAAAFRVGLIVKFVPISEMVDWENGFSQDEFNVATFEQDAGLRSISTSEVSGTSFAVPKWISFCSPITIQALPDGSNDITVSPTPMDVGSTPTVQSFQLISQTW